MPPLMGPVQPGPGRVHSEKLAALSLRFAPTPSPTRHNVATDAECHALGVAAQRTVREIDGAVNGLARWSPYDPAAYTLRRAGARCRDGLRWPAAPVDPVSFGGAKA